MKLQQKIAIGFYSTKIKLLQILSNRLAAKEAFRLFCTPVNKSAIKENELFNKAEPLQFTLNEVLIKGYRFNHPGKHKILLLHGFSSSAVNFFRYVTPLMEKNYEVLAFDAPAHGASEGKKVNTLVYAAMIKKIISLYGPIDGFIAHSFGGLSLALAMEQVPHDENTRLVFIAPSTETTTAINDAFKLLGLRNKKTRAGFDKIIFDISGKETAWFSVRRAMNNIKASVLWLHDEDDDITPLVDALEVKNDNHSNVEFIITKGLGHRKIYHDKDVIDRIIKFL